MSSGHLSERAATADGLAGEEEKFLTTHHERDQETELDYRGARFYDSDIGRFLSLDPLAMDYPALSDYVYVAGNPVTYIDPNGKQIVDPKGRNVTITRNEDGSLNYQFHEKTKKKHRDQFMRETAPILEAMNGSKLGWEDIQTLSKLETRVSIILNEGTNENANSTITPFGDNQGILTKTEQYKEVVIEPFLGNYSENSSADLNEWVGAVMTVEVGHLAPEQIALEAEGYSGDPKDPSFSKVYQGLLNKAFQFRSAYRIEHGQPITEEVFAPIEKANAAGANIQYTRDNEIIKQEFDNNRN